MPVTALCDYFFGRLNGLALKRNVLFECKFVEADASLGIETDDAIFKRIIVNLLVNAITNAGPNRDVRLTFRRTSRGCFVHVYDTGPGMVGLNGPDRARNFALLTERMAKEEYQRQQGTPIDALVVPNNGLGLLNVERLCKDLSISVTMHSTLGRGTDFCLKVPVALTIDPDARA